LYLIDLIDLIIFYSILFLEKKIEFFANFFKKPVMYKKWNTILNCKREKICAGCGRTIYESCCNSGNHEILVTNDDLPFHIHCYDFRNSNFYWYGKDLKPKNEIQFHEILIAREIIMHGSESEKSKIGKIKWTIDNHQYWPQDFKICVKTFLCVRRVKNLKNFLPRFILYKILEFFSRITYR